jgi:hypothetical protein
VVLPVMLPVTTASWALRQAASSDITRPTSRTLNPQRQAARRDLLLGKQNSPEGRWNVIEGERRNRVWPPLHRRDLQRRSLPRIDPADRCVPTWPLERIRRATAICHLQRDVFKRSGLDLIPTNVSRRSHYTFPSPTRRRSIDCVEPQSKTDLGISAAAGYAGHATSETVEWRAAR